MSWRWIWTGSRTDQSLAVDSAAVPIVRRWACRTRGCRQRNCCCSTPVIGSTETRSNESRSRQTVSTSSRRSTAFVMRSRTALRYIARCWPKTSPRFGRISISFLRRSVHRDLRRLGGAIHRRLDRLSNLIRRYRRPRECQGGGGQYHCLPSPEKGTATVLEQLARMSPAGMRGRWNFSVARNQSIYDHLRPTNLSTVDLRNWEALERRDTAFNAIARIPSTCGVLRHSRALQYSQRRPVPPALGCVCGAPLSRLPRRRRTVSVQSLGNNQPLFTRPRSGITHLAEPLNVPEPISRRVLDAVSCSILRPCNSLFLEADNLDTSLEKVQVCNLADNGATWAHLPVSKVWSIRYWENRRSAWYSAGQSARDVPLWVQRMPTGGGSYERGKTGLRSAAGLKSW